ncbi:hypothetical protein C0Q70_14344 [Pomacea canaliculata]|uniref:Uncharacterized protein n=1 Tax=Pomacea canaliculata TaxID=400727 RepID=A0A2T7NZT3_POMCA|nr:hypothetical protein C0Q70_14344 [Pomacea canaliculata]
MPDVMSCDLSSGEVTLKSHAKFASLKLCRKKLPRALDSAPAPALSNKEIHIEGRVEKVRVDIGANYLIIDLVPFRFNTATKHSPCFREDRGRLQVRVMLHPKRWCQPLDEIQEYLYDKTLDIWTDFQSLKHCRPKRSGFQIPFESEHYWMMVSQRVFYSKR